MITTKKEYTEDTDVERSSTNVAVCIVCVCIFIGALALVFLL